MLDPLAAELHQKLLDLTRGLARLLIERDANLSVWRSHGLGGQAGVLALDVEVTDLAEVEQALVEGSPVRHSTAVDVVGQVVHRTQAYASWMAVDPRQPLEVDVVDALAVLIAVDQVQRRAADAFDGWQAQLHRAGWNLDRLRAQRQRSVVGLVSVAHPEGQAAGRWPVLGGKVGSLRLGLAVHDEVDLALPVQQHVLGAVLGHQGEAHLLEQGLEHAGRGGRELDELEALESHGVVKQIGHRVCSCSAVEELAL